MAYTIFYWRDLAMTRQTRDMDVVGDAGLGRAPTGTEVALAQHSNDQSLTVWGYAGAWHGAPPAEVEAETRRLEAERWHPR